MGSKGGSYYDDPASCETHPSVLFHEQELRSVAFGSNDHVECDPWHRVTARCGLQSVVVQGDRDDTSKLTKLIHKLERVRLELATRCRRNCGAEVRQVRQLFLQLCSDIANLV